MEVKFGMDLKDLILLMRMINCFKYFLIFSTKNLKNYLEEQDIMEEILFMKEQLFLN